MFAELLQQKLTGILTLSDDQITGLTAHYELLCRWNRKLNLTSIDSMAEAVERHYCESLFLAAHLPPNPLRIVDIGSGAGFPGIPVAVVRADCLVALVEAHARKAVFLRESTRQIGNVQVLAKRVEDVEERFDHAVSRAVSYEDLISTLRRVTHHADLLTGEKEPPSDLGFQWEPPIGLPWGRQRFLRIGVSRGTQEKSFGFT